MSATAEGDDVDNGCGGADGSWLGFGGEVAKSEREDTGATRCGPTRWGAVRPGARICKKNLQPSSINAPPTGAAQVAVKAQMATADSAKSANT